jgi:hypothetical protein
MFSAQNLIQEVCNTDDESCLQQNIADGTTFYRKATGIPGP